MILRFAGEPGTTATCAAGALDQAGLVGAGEAIGFGFGEGALQDGPAEALRRLRLHDVLARDRGADDGAVRGALDLLDGVDGGQADDGGAMLGNGFDGARDGVGVDQGADGVVHQHDVIVLRLHGRKGASDGFLTAVAAFDDSDAAGELVFGDDGLDTFNFRGADRDHDGADLRHGGKGAQTVDENGKPGEMTGTAWRHSVRLAPAPCGCPGPQPEE